MAVDAEAARPTTFAACCAPVTGGELSDDDADQLAGILHALADPVRLKMYSMIAASGSVCSCDFQEPLGKSQPTISHHTRILAAAGLISGEKQGRWTVWTVVPGQLDALRSALQ